MKVKVFKNGNFNVKHEPEYEEYSLNGRIVFTVGITYKAYVEAIGG